MKMAEDIENQTHFEGLLAKNRPKPKALHTTRGRPLSLGISFSKSDEPDDRNIWLKRFQLHAYNFLERPKSVKAITYHVTVYVPSDFSFNYY